jgi:hypothetical protein
MKYKGGNLGLTSTQIKVLDYVNFNWVVPHEVKWNKTYADLVKFHAAKDHCNVPCDGSSLGNQVNQQRQSKKNDNLTNGRIRLLMMSVFHGAK